MKIKTIKKNLLTEPKKFYDITVDKYHNFLIGRNSMIVTHNSSLNSAIINMAQRFKNNLPLLMEDGQFGSLRSPQPGAARYIGTKLNKIFYDIYRDNNLLEFNIEEGEKIEPKFFLPIIPMVLVNGSQGIAVGFASNILNRNAIDVITACENKLKGKKVSKISPSIPGFIGTFKNDEDNNKKWNIRGVFERTNTTTVTISELPPSMTYEKYETILDELMDKKLITNYDDKSKGNVNYIIKFQREQLSKMSDEQLVKLLKLEESQTDNFNTLDENGKLKIFESDVDIIEYFVDFRLKYYQKRKDHMLTKSERESKILKNRILFIKAIIDEKIDIKNKNKDYVTKAIESLNLDKIDDDYDYLLRLPIWYITKDYYEKLKSELKDKFEEIKNIKSLITKDMYLEDLSNLKKDIKKFVN